MKNLTKEFSSSGYLTSTNYLRIILLCLLLSLELFPKKVLAVPPVLSVSPNHAYLTSHDVSTWATLGSVTLTMPSFNVEGATAITWNSDNLEFYGIIKVTPEVYHLAIVDVTSGVCTNIGLMDGFFVSLTFSSLTHILYTMDINQNLYSVDVTTGATTFLSGFSFPGSMDAVIAYNYDDGYIYHWTGYLFSNMEKINLSTYARTSITQSGGHDIIAGAVYIGNGVFRATDYTPFFSKPGTSLSITSNGAAASLGTISFYGERGLSMVSQALPVELSSFVSSISNNNVKLNWTSATETNNSGFDIERSNVKDQTSNEWIKVGSVAGNGTTTSVSNYTFNDRNLNSGNYNYRLKQIDFNGNFEYFNLSNEVIVGIPAKFELSQNYPNPFNPATKIKYQLPNDGNVNISVFDNAGKEVASLVNEFKSAGYYTFNFNAASLSSGVYFYKITSGNFSSVKKMMLVK